MDAASNFLQVGPALGRNPSPLFDATRYLFDNPDVAAAGINPLLHYLRHGRSEGRVIFAISR